MKTQKATRQLRGIQSERRGHQGEHLAEQALERDGWTILARRLRTPAGELDLIVQRDGLAAIVEVKSRPTLAEAASCLQPRQQGRIMAAAEIALSEHPDWGEAGVRFDVMLVDTAGRVRRVADAFRATA